MDHEEPDNFFSSTDTFTLIESSRMRWAAHQLCEGLFIIYTPHPPTNFPKKFVGIKRAKWERKWNQNVSSHTFTPKVVTKHTCWTVSHMSAHVSRRKKQHFIITFQNTHHTLPSFCSVLICMYLDHKTTLGLQMGHKLSNYEETHIERYNTPKAWEVV